MHQENIRLRNAMTQELNQQVRAWDVPGLQVEVDELPKNATVSRTVVMKSPNRDYQLLISYTIEGDLKSYLGEIATFSTLEELQEKHPQLFELDGYLYAFA